MDGINLDYIRYPDGWPRPSYRDGDTPDQRRSNITAIVRAIHDEVKAIKPWVKMSCSPIGKHADLSRYSSKNFNAHDRVSQEAQEWMRLGLMDQLYPMQYFRGDNYYPFVADWVENAYKREIVTGLGTYFLDPREGNWTLGDLTRQMYVSRDLGVGHAHFRSYSSRLISRVSTTLRKQLMLRFLSLIRCRVLCQRLPCHMLSTPHW